MPASQHQNPKSDIEISQSAAKRRIIERVKRADSITASELAGEFGLTDTAIRQHLEALEAVGLVSRKPGPASSLPAVTFALILPDSESASKTTDLRFRNHDTAWAAVENQTSFCERPASSLK